MSTMAMSLNGQSVNVLNDLYEKMQPAFKSLLGDAQNLGQDFTPSSLGKILEKFNTGMESLGLVKNTLQGNLPDVLVNLSNLTETYFESMSETADQAAELGTDLDLDPDMSPSPSPGSG